MILPPRLLRAALAVVALGTVAGLAAAVACGPNNITVWICLNPKTGKEDGSIYDPNHYVNGVLDPCHCYDPCGPERSCPIVVDAGPPVSGCDAGTGAGGGG